MNAKALYRDPRHNLPYEFHKKHKQNSDFIRLIFSSAAVIRNSNKRNTVIRMHANCRTTKNFILRTNFQHEIRNQNTHQTPVNGFLFHLTKYTISPYVSEQESICFRIKTSRNFRRSIRYVEHFEIMFERQSASIKRQITEASSAWQISVTAI